MTPLSVNLRHLRALPAMSDLGSMNAAAAAVGLSQPALAQGLAKLEAQFGARLFVRGAGGMRPTAEGEIVIERARLVADRLRVALRSLPGGRRRPSEPLEQMVTWTQIRALLGLAEGGSFLGAARTTGASQPAIHRAVRELEALLRVPLTAREGPRAVLTDAGRQLVRHLRIAVADLQAAREEVTGEDGAASISIGAMPLCRALLLPDAIARAMAGPEPLHVDVVEGSYAELVEPLRDGRIDCAVGALRSHGPSDLVQTPLFLDRLATIARADHPLARDLATLADLRAYPWIVGRRGSPLRGHWEQMFGAALPDAPIECGSVMTIRGLLLSGDYLTLLSPDQVALEIRSGLLTVLDTDLPAAERTIGLITRADWRPTRAQAGFVEILKSIATSQETE